MRTRSKRAEGGGVRIKTVDVLVSTWPQRVGRAKPQMGIGLDRMYGRVGRRPVALHGQYSAESMGRGHTTGGAEGWWWWWWAVQ